MIYGLAILLGAIMPIAAATSSPGTEQWYRDGEQTVQAARHLKANRWRARNLILFIGDGMGVSTVTAARILEGQQRGQPGEENLLSLNASPM